uniref:Integrase, catalytic region, zinc finger, CCHC-type, peptidase aspartic, catalytic n=1 Tax=Tanacetum cinerariifolium TaxID=118510 RepID=A0A6L2KD18_TANCI|nr:hypothetical protein [Tanacetum cinerariifolium]
MQTQTSSALHNDTISSCSTSNVQETTQLSRSVCMHSLGEVKKLFKFLTENLNDFGIMPIFKRTFSHDLDLLEQHLSKDILSQTDCNTTLENLKKQFENAFNSDFKEQDLKGTRIEYGFKRAFMSLFGQDADTFTSTMLLNVDLLQKQLDKDKFQEDGSMIAFWGVNNQFQEFIDSQYDRRVNKRVMQTQKSKVDMGKAVNDDLVVTESSGTKSEVQDDNSRSGNDTDAHDTDIRPIYDEEPMTKVQLTAECNIFTIGQWHTEQPEIINEGRVDHSNDMVYDHYLDEAKKNTQERDRNSKPSVMTPARFQSTTANSKPKPRSTNHSSRSLSMCKSSCVTMPAMPKADHSKNPSGNPRVEFLKSVDLRWLPTGKVFNSCRNKVESEPPHGSNVDISKIHEYKQTLDFSAGTSINVSKEQSLDVSTDQNSSDPTPECQTMALNHDSLSPAIQRQEKVTHADRTVTTSNELDLLFSLMFDELLNGFSKIVSKFSTVSAADAPNQRQQYTTPLNNHTTPAPLYDEFINILSNPVQDQGETSTRHLADLFTKALPVERFQYLIRRLGMRCLTPAELEALANEPA